MDNKWIRAAIPALLIHCSIGTVYCWSTFKEAIANQIGVSAFLTGWAFSLAIFFLGMSAAFAGRIVELDIHRSSLISCICFTTGMIGTGLAIQYFKGTIALLLIYLFYGCIMGIGLGIGYLTPVKTLMLWFDKQKGFATGISIMGFGLAKAIATPIMEFIQVRSNNISLMFYILGVVYFCMMFLGHTLLKKPNGWVEPKVKESGFSLKNLLKDKSYIMIWVMFYLNIHCGLMIISYEKQVIKTYATGDIVSVLISLIPSVTALCNALGRIGYATISDRLRDRSVVYEVIAWTCMFVGDFTVIMLVRDAGILIEFWVILFLMVVNVGYGGGFSTLPALLSQKFGMKDISKIHGITLTAWAMAGLTGNNMSAIILNLGMGFQEVIFTMCLLYTIMFICSISLTSGNDK